MQIKRQSYLNRLINKKRNGLIKVVTGVRRCGKSYLLFNLFHEHLLEECVDESHIIEIALDDRTNIKLRNPDNMLECVKGRKYINSPAKYYLRTLDLLSITEKTKKASQRRSSLRLISWQLREVKNTISNRHFQCLIPKRSSRSNALLKA